MISFFLGKHGYADVSGEEAAAEAKDIAGLNAVETYQCSEIQLIHAESFAKRTHVGEHLIHLPHLIFHGRIYQDANGQHHSDYGGAQPCRAIREDPQLRDTMVVFLSALGEEDQQLTGFGVGADDYLTKPIKMKLLVSRVQAILKRIDAETAPAEPAAAGIAVDREHYTVTRDGHEIALPRKEFALLDLLYSSPGKLFSREEIYTKIWGTEVVVGDRTIDVHIRKLRQKIGDERIVTIKGVGYKFEP